MKRYILSGIRDGPQEPAIADSIDFVVSQVPNLFFMWSQLRDSHYFVDITATLHIKQAVLNGYIYKNQI